MRQELSDIHRFVSIPCGEICLSIELWRVLGGRRSLKRWARVFREAADRLDKLAC
jgi:hypothetical protein